MREDRESSRKPCPATAREIVERLRALGDPERARVLRGFFKTGPGQYGQGDVFAGLRVPEIRKLAGEYGSLDFPGVIRLLRSPLHEARLLALLVLIRRYGEGDASVRGRVYRAYLKHTRFVNNWDLVDLSAEHIVGAHLADGGRETLYALASSDLLWERRIAVMATFHFIRRGDFSDTFHIAGMLLGDPEDLIHKAVGWMLREIGKRDRPAEESFLREHCRVMPRTMLRYAIEKFPEPLRKRYLKGDV